MAAIRKRIAEAREAAEIEDEGVQDDIGDENKAQTQTAHGIIKKKKKRKMKRVKWIRVPDMTELSLPKPASRLDADLDLSGSEVLGTHQVPHELSTPDIGTLPAGVPGDADVHVLKGFEPTESKPDDLRVAQYRRFYAKQVAAVRKGIDTD